MRLRVSSHTLRAVRWRTILAFRARISFGRTLQALLAGYAVNSILPARLGEFFRGAAFGQYEAALRQQTAELNDLFLLLCFMEATALPNPATLYLLEVYPYLLEQFHQWHRRMGIEHSPIGSLPCC